MEYFEPSGDVDEMQDDLENNIGCEEVFEELGLLYSEMKEDDPLSVQNRLNTLISRFLF